MPAEAAVPVIDCHAHIIPPRLVATLLSAGSRCGVEVGGGQNSTTIRLEGSSWTKPPPEVAIADASLVLSGVGHAEQANVRVRRYGGRNILYAAAAEQV
jgi:hypothetical protein